MATPSMRGTAMTIRSPVFPLPMTTALMVPDW